MSREAAADLIRSASTRDVGEANDLLDLMAAVTGEEPDVDGRAIGFGSYHYRYETGREGDFFKVGFSPTRHGITIYVMSGLRGFDDILTRLGPHTATKSTVKIKSLADIDRTALADLIEACVAHLDETERTLGAIPRMSEIPPRIV